MLLAARATNSLGMRGRLYRLWVRLTRGKGARVTNEPAKPATRPTKTSLATAAPGARARKWATTVGRILAVVARDSTRGLGACSALAAAGASLPTRRPVAGRGCPCRLRRLANKAEQLFRKLRRPILNVGHRASRLSCDRLTPHHRVQACASRRKHQPTRHPPCSGSASCPGRRRPWRRLAPRTRSPAPKAC